MSDGLGGLGKGDHPKAPQRAPKDAAGADPDAPSADSTRVATGEDIQPPPRSGGANNAPAMQPPVPEPAEQGEASAPEPDIPLPGQVMFNPPQRMRLGKAERVEVRVVQNTKTDLTQNLRGSGTPIVEQHRVSKIMRVSLTGEKFDIVALSELEQVVTDDDFTEWSFTVKPLEGGQLQLHLAVTQVLDIPGRGEKAKTLPVIDRPIDVEVDSFYMASAFAKENWEWLASGVLLPVAAWGAEHMRRKRRRARKEAQATAKRSGVQRS